MPQEQRGQSKTTICYLPGGDITKVVTIEIANPAVDKHIDLHGDFIGPCPGEEESLEPLTAQYYPALCTMVTLAFGDRWPFFGDYDFNDLVVYYHYGFFIDNQNNIRTMDITLKVDSTGATYDNGFAIKLPFNPSLVTNITGQHLTKNVFNTNEIGFEPDGDGIVLPLFEFIWKIYKCLPRRKLLFSGSLDDFIRLCAWN